MNESKKEEEIEILSGFLRRLQINNCKIEEREQPDFSLLFSRGSNSVTIGCEITKYYSDKTKKGSEQAGFDSRWKAFSKDLSERLAKSNSWFKNRCGSIHFKESGNRILKSIDFSNFANEVTKLINSNENVSIIEEIKPDVSAMLHDTVDRIILPNSTYGDNDWFYGHKQTGEIPDSTDEIVKIIEVKNGKAKNYESDKIDEIWLLIYSGTELLSENIGLLDSTFIINKITDSKFSRIYIWDKFLEEINEIYPSSQTIFKPSFKVLSRKLYSERVREFVIDGGNECGV